MDTRTYIVMNRIITFYPYKVIPNLKDKSINAWTRCNLGCSRLTHDSYFENTFRSFFRLINDLRHARLKVLPVRLKYMLLDTYIRKADLQ